MRGLHGKVAVTTAAAQGIGAATAGRLAEEGASVVVTDLDGDGAEAVARSIRDAGGQAVALAADVRSRRDLQAAADLAVEHFGGIDVFHSNVGPGLMAPLEATSEEAIRAIVETNVIGGLNVLAVAAPALRDHGGGSLVMTSSVVANFGTPAQTAYSATKGAVVSMMRAAAMEFAPAVRINCICPGAIKTEGTRQHHGEDQVDLIEQLTIIHTPLARIGCPADIAAAVAFLASDESSYITGETITVSGGWTVGAHRIPDELQLRDAGR